jgi:type II secretory pathway component PulJ
MVSPYCPAQGHAAACPPGGVDGWTIPAVGARRRVPAGWGAGGIFVGAMAFLARSLNRTAPRADRQHPPSACRGRFPHRPGGVGRSDAGRRLPCLPARSSRHDWRTRGRVIERWRARGSVPLHPNGHHTPVVPTRNLQLVARHLQPPAGASAGGVATVRPFVGAMACLARSLNRTAPRAERQHPPSACRGRFPHRPGGVGRSDAGRRLPCLPARSSRHDWRTRGRVIERWRARGSVPLHPNGHHAPEVPTRNL